MDRDEGQRCKYAWAGNLLVDDALCVRVADFGLARVMHDLHTLTGGLGTFQWMAPEVLAHQRYSKKADVYSFAVVLWECTARQVRTPSFGEACSGMLACHHKSPCRISLLMQA